MNKALITAGAIKENSFKGVCYAVSQLEPDIKIIHIIDTEASAMEADKYKRNQVTRKYFGNIEIRSSLINDHDMQQKIPALLSSLIRDFSIENIYVDLSNGQKILTGVLYAVATISQIPNIYAMELRPGLDLTKSIEDFNKNEDWNYVSIKPLSEIKNISQSSQIELIYYRDNIREVIEMLDKIDPRFSLDSRYRLENSLTDYFSALVMSDDEKKIDLLERCVNGLGKICEDIAFRIFDVFQKNNLISEGIANSNNFVIDKIFSALDNARKSHGDKIQEHSESIFPLLALGNQLRIMQIYRNFSAHHDRRYIFCQRDARLALDITLLMLDRIANNLMFQSKDPVSEELSS